MLSLSFATYLLLSAAVLSFVFFMHLEQKHTDANKTRPILIKRTKNKALLFSFILFVLAFLFAILSLIFDIWG